VVSLWWDYPFPTRSTTVAYCIQPVSVIWVYHSFRWHQLNWYSYLLSLASSLRDGRPTSSFTINTKGLAVRLMPSLVRWPEGLDTFQYQRPKTFACIIEYHSHWYVALWKNERCASGEVPLLLGTKCFTPLCEPASSRSLRTTVGLTPW
jgi:hypothetical protein